MRSWVCSHSRSFLSLVKSLWLWKMTEVRSGLTAVVQTLISDLQRWQRTGQKFGGILCVIKYSTTIITAVLPAYE